MLQISLEFCAQKAGDVGTLPTRIQSHCRYNLIDFASKLRLKF